MRYIGTAHNQRVGSECGPFFIGVDQFRGTTDSSTRSFPTVFQISVSISR